MPKTFKHSGDLGDIIFSLPAIRALGGGVLYLDPQGGFNDPLFVKYADKTRTKLTAEQIDSISPLLLAQPYIQEVRHWRGEKVDHELDIFRQHVRFNNLSDSHLAPFELPLAERDKAWISVKDPIAIKDRPIVVNRTPRYHGCFTFWEMNLPDILPRAVFVGYPKEHEIFEYTFGRKIEYYPTPDVLTLARVIAGAEHFMGNQGLAHAIAEGMKKDLTHEYYRLYPAAIFRRTGAQYV